VVVGEPVGDEVVGVPVGDAVGDEVVGEPVGEVVGDEVVGEPVGEMVGDDVVGVPVGEVVVDEVVGEPLGLSVGDCVVGVPDGAAVGATVRHWKHCTSMQSSISDSVWLNASAEVWSSHTIVRGLYSTPKHVADSVHALIHSAAEAAVISSNVPCSSVSVRQQPDGVSSRH
jgi:hypothetical protein